MNLNAIDNKYLLFIKVLSTVLITGAIALELLENLLQPPLLPASLAPILWFATFALVSHLIEGTIGAIVAFRRQKNAIAAGIYIFFTGTVGLLEILATPTELI